MLIKDRLAGDVHLISLGHLSSLADFIIVATATSKPHLEALETRLRQELKTIHVGSNKPTEGNESESWRVVDAGFAIIHLMSQEARSKFNLEHIWSEGKRIALTSRRPTARRRGKAKEKIPAFLRDK